MENKQFGCENLSPAELQEINGGILGISIPQMVNVGVVAAEALILAPLVIIGGLTRVVPPTHVQSGLQLSDVELKIEAGWHVVPA